MATVNRNKCISEANQYYLVEVILDNSNLILANVWLPINIIFDLSVFFEIHSLFLTNLLFIVKGNNNNYTGNEIYFTYNALGPYVKH